MTTINSKVLFAMAMDPSVGDREYRVATLLMMEDGAALTQVELASALGRTERCVGRALKRLREAGWVTSERANRHETNEYYFHIPESERDERNARSNL